MADVAEAIAAEQRDQEGDGEKALGRNGRLTLRVKRFCEEAALAAPAGLSVSRGCRWRPFTP